MLAPSPPSAFGTKIPRRRCSLTARNASAGNRAALSTEPAFAAAIEATVWARVGMSAGPGSMGRGTALMVTEDSIRVMFVHVLFLAGRYAKNSPGAHASSRYMTQITIIGVKG